jgi:hypothetical protein
VIGKTTFVAKIDHAFSMPGTIGEAQARFVEDIAPALHRLGQFALYRQTPGYIAFSDGLVDPMTLSRDGGLYALGRRLFAHKIKVDFADEGAGTRVTVRGGAPRDIRDEIVLLGCPGHWPQTEPDRA